MGINTELWIKVAEKDLALSTMLLHTIMVPLMVFCLVGLLLLHCRTPLWLHRIFHTLAGVVMISTAGLVIYCWFVIAYGNTAMVFAVPALATVKLETAFWVKKNYAKKHTFA